MKWPKFLFVTKCPSFFETPCIYIFVLHYTLHVVYQTTWPIIHNSYHGAAMNALKLPDFCSISWSCPASSSFRSADCANPNWRARLKDHVLYFTYVNNELHLLEQLLTHRRVHIIYLRDVSRVTVFVTPCIDMYFEMEHVDMFSQCGEKTGDLIMVRPIKCHLKKYLGNKTNTHCF